jgi:hypothetical protein
MAEFPRTKNKLTNKRPDTSSVSEMLTPSEIEQLRQEKKDDHAFFQKAFAQLRKPE